MLTEASQSIWQQVSTLRPCLRHNIQVQSHVFRGEKWHVLHDRTSGKFLRFNQSAYDVVGRFTGAHTLSDIVELINAQRSPEFHIGHDDVMAILAQLQEFEALKGGMPVSTADALARYQKRQKMDFLKQWGNPIAIRIPLIDPDRILATLLAPSRRIFSYTGLSVWLSIIVFAGVIASLNITPIFTQIAQKSGSASSLFILILLYPVIKLLHEIGHGLAVKTWGGEVHEAGILLLLFFPVPYVDASASWSFRDKRKRMIVSGAGIMVEMLLASLAIVLWSLTEPGIINSLALDVAIIGGLSTLLYNGNPLLRFDGYYVLEDLVEIPNLGSRSWRYYCYLAQRYLLGSRIAVSPVMAKGEVPWFLLYGFLSPLYRLSVLLGIAIYLSGKYLVIGVLLALFAVFKQVVQPIVRALLFVIDSSREGYNRKRGMTVTAVLVSLVLLVLTIEVPRVTRSQGVVFTADSGQINAVVGGDISTVHFTTGDRVRQGDVILSLKNRDMASRVSTLRRKLDELTTAAHTERQKSRVRGAIAQSNVAAVAAELAEREEQLQALTVKSPVDGTLIFNDPHIRADHYVKDGSTIAFVVQGEQPIVRAVVDQGSSGNFDAGVTAVQVVLANNLNAVIDASFVRAVPAAGTRLPSRALGTAGGGTIPVDSSDTSGLSAMHQVFQFDLQLPPATVTAGIGERAFIRLTHGKERIWRQLSRKLQQLFLSQLGI